MFFVVNVVRRRIADSRVVRINTSADRSVSFFKTYIKSFICKKLKRIMLGSVKHASVAFNVIPFIYLVVLYTSVYADFCISVLKYSILPAQGVFLNLIARRVTAISAFTIHSNRTKK